VFPNREGYGVPRLLMGGQGYGPLVESASIGMGMVLMVMLRIDVDSGLHILGKCFRLGGRNGGTRTRGETSMLSRG
jgi:hypothetical protein